MVHMEGTPDHGADEGEAGRDTSELVEGLRGLV